MDFDELENAPFIDDDEDEDIDDDIDDEDFGAKKIHHENCAPIQDFYSRRKEEETKERQILRNNNYGQNLATMSAKPIIIDKMMARKELAPTISVPTIIHPSANNSRQSSNSVLLLKQTDFNPKSIFGPKIDQFLSQNSAKKEEEDNNKKKKLITESWRSKIGHQINGLTPPPPINSSSSSFDDDHSSTNEEEDIKREEDSDDDSLKAPINPINSNPIIILKKVPEEEIKTPIIILNESTNHQVDEKKTRPPPPRIQINDEVKPRPPPLTIINQTTTNQTTTTKVIQASTTELLKFLGERIVKEIPKKINGFCSNDVIFWLRSVDRSLLVQGWQEIPFINPANLVFLYLLMKESLDCIKSFDYHHQSKNGAKYDFMPLPPLVKLQEIQSLVLTSLYLSYGFMGNEISYPLKPFLCDFDSRQEFFSRALFLIKQSSHKMLLINSDSSYFTFIFSDLLGLTNLNPLNGIIKKNHEKEREEEENLAPKSSHQNPLLNKNNNNPIVSVIRRKKQNNQKIRSNSFSFPFFHSNSNSNNIIGKNNNINLSSSNQNQDHEEEEEDERNEASISRRRHQSLTPPTLGDHHHHEMKQPIINNKVMNQEQQLINHSIIEEENKISSSSCSFNRRILPKIPIHPNLLSSYNNKEEEEEPIRREEEGMKIRSSNGLKAPKIHFIQQQQKSLINSNSDTINGNSISSSKTVVNNSNSNNSIKLQEPIRSSLRQYHSNVNPINESINPSSLNQYYYSIKNE